MSSLIENLEEAGRVNTALTELIREAHSTIKTLRRTEREVRDNVKELVDKYTDEAIKPELTKMTDIVKKQLEASVDHVMSEFDKVAKPILQTMDILEKSNLAQDIQNHKGAFFDRG